MSSDIIKIAKKYIINNYSVIPITQHKNPAISEWGKYLYNPMPIHDVDRLFKNSWGLALLMGGKKSLTAIDIDSKYDLTNTLWDRLQCAIGDDLLNKMWINKTTNGGYHLVFSCPKIEGNSKLAGRETTDTEKINTFKEESSKGSKAEVALKAGFSDSSRVLIETRGCGGYILIPPSPGYQTIKGKIQTLTVDEYDFVFDTCRSFNEYIKPVKNYALSKLERDKGKDLLASFNQKADVVKILEDHGWSQVGVDGTRIKMKRPGNVSSKDSGWFDTESRVFWVFSTSTSFRANEGYSAVDVLLELKYDGDNSRLNELYRDIKENS